MAEGCSPKGTKVKGDQEDQDGDHDQEKTRTYSSSRRLRFCLVGRINKSDVRGVVIREQKEKKASKQARIP